MHKNNICYQQNVLLSLSQFLQELYYLDKYLGIKTEDVRKKHHEDIRDITYADKRNFYL